MELVRDLFVPAVDAAGTVVDRLLPAEAARSDGRRPPPSFRSKLSAYLAMVPAADFLSDCALFSVLLHGAQYTWALAVGRAQPPRSVAAPARHLWRVADRGLPELRRAARGC